MKKVVMFAVAALMAVAAQAQFVVGLQGGYHYETASHSWNDDQVKGSSWLGGLQLGYQVTPKLYVGVMGGYGSTTSDSLVQFDTLASYSNRTNVPIEDRQHTWSRPGWTVKPMVRYEIFKYGNMHFHLLLQGSISSTGYASHQEHFVTPSINNREYIEADPWKDSVSTFSWGVSLRPTLTYEFSEHLSAELCLDFLSIGYMNTKETHEADFHTVDGERVNDVYRNSSLYAGLNTLMETLRWESPMFRLGFNYKF